MAGAAPRGRQAAQAAVNANGPGGRLAGERERCVDPFDAEDTREGVNACFKKRDPHWHNG